MKEKELLSIVVKAADDKHAEDITIMNMDGISLVADYFVICHGNSDKQVQAIAREIKDKAHQYGHDVERMEGFDNARWVLIDLGYVVIHIFHSEERRYYSLERLWGDAPRETLESVL